MFIIKEEKYKMLRRPAPGESESFYLLKRQPILCGILAFEALVEMQIGGVNLCDTWASITYPSQLYMALKNMPDPVRQVSPGMDHVISIHTEERLFIGSAPKTIEESFRQSLLMQRFSASNFAKNRRPGRGAPLRISKAGPRGLQETSTLAKLLRP